MGNRLCRAIGRRIRRQTPIDERIEHVQPAWTSKDGKRYATLHPTKGFRAFSVKRIAAQFHMAHLLGGR